MKALTVTLFLVITELTICQAQTKLDTNRIHDSSQQSIIHLHDERALSTNKPLIIAQGKEVTDINKFNPNSIKSMDVIGPTDPRRKAYGPKGQYGVIVLELKSDSTFQKSPK